MQGVRKVHCDSAAPVLKLLRNILVSRKWGQRERSSLPLLPLVTDLKRGLVTDAHPHPTRCSNSGPDDKHNEGAAESNAYLHFSEQWAS